MGLVERTKRAMAEAEALNCRPTTVSLTAAEEHELMLLLPRDPFVKYAPRCVKNFLGLEVIYDAERFEVS